MKNKLQWFGRHKVLSAILVVIIIIIASTSANNSTSTKSNNQPASNTSSQSQKQSTAAKQAPAQPAQRKVTGKATALGAGTFTGGTDVAAGLYDVTPGPGQSGNFIVSGTDTYNEILGTADSLGVPKVRAQISSGDKIEISSLSQVTFTPVTTPFVTAHATTNLYAGTFIVGQDIGPGRYVAAPGSGQSGNFIVSGSNSYNEILGTDSSLGEVPKVSVTLDKGDVIAISGLSQVTLTAQ